MKKIKLIILLFVLSSTAIYSKGHDITVLQINVWQEGTMVEGGFDAITNEIARLNPDIVLLSEVRNYHGEQFITRVIRALKEKGKEYYGENSTLDVGILSKYKILEQYPTPASPEEAVRVLKARIEIEGHTVVVYSAHLDYTHYACYLPRGYSGVTWKKLDAPILDSKEIEKANKESLRDEAIVGVIEDVKKENGNIIILGGDFNEPSHLDWQENTKDLWDHNGTTVRWDCSVLLTQNGFKDAYREVYPNPVTHPGFTFPSDNPNVDVKKLAWAPEADERDRIDFVYFMPNKKLKLVDAAIVGPNKSIIRGERSVENSKDKFILPAGVWPTDHKALLVSFKLKN